MTDTIKAEKPTKASPPDYPFIDLETAVSRVKAFYTAERRSPVAFDVLAHHWGYKAKSSGVALTVSSLKKFGLVEKAETGKVKLTDLALHIALGEDAEIEYIQALKTAAMSPEIYSILWDKYGADLPPENSLKKTLVMEYKYNDMVAVDIINKYRRSISFAKLTVSDQTNSQDGGAPEREKSVIPPPPGGKNLPPPPAVQKQPGAREFRFPLANGDAIFSVPPGTTEQDMDLLIETLKLWKPRVVNEAKEK